MFVYFLFGFSFALFFFFLDINMVEHFHPRNRVADSDDIPGNRADGNDPAEANEILDIVESEDENDGGLYDAVSFSIVFSCFFLYLC